MEEDTRLFVCQCCTSYSSQNFRRLVNHLRFVHPFSEITCNINGCKSIYSSTTTLIRHIKNRHFWFWKQYWKGTQELMTVTENENNINMLAFDGNPDNIIDIDEGDFGNVDNENENDILDRLNTSHSAEAEPTLDPEVVEDLVVTFLLELRENKKASGVACEYVARKMSALLDMLDISQQHVLSAVEQTLNVEQNRLLNDTWKNVSSSIFKTIFNKFSHQKTFNAYISKQRCFVAPVELRLNENDDLCDSESFQYISLLKTLKVLLGKENNLKHCLRESSPNQSNIQSFKDGDIFQKSLFWKSSPRHLQIFLYYDEFNCANPLGNKVRKCKISAFYFVLGNIPRKERSVLSSINLLLLCKSKYFEQYGYGPILEPIIKDLSILEEEGIEIVVDGANQVFFGSLALVIADNLAQHGIGGFFESFSKTKRFCRFCMCHRDNIADHFNDDDVVKRTNNQYETNLEAMSVNPELGKIYGLKRSSELNKLNYFNIIGQLPFDLHHDIFEGVAIDVVSEVIKHFVKNGVFSIQNLNDSIKTFKFAECDKSDKPQLIYISGSLNDFKIKSTAIEMSNLLRLLPFLVGIFIEEDDDVWELFINFVSVVQFILAPSLKRGEVFHLKDLIQDFFLKYVQLFPEIKIKPKGHFLTHYPSQIMNLGPPSDHATIRFEAKHHFFKDIYHRSNNTINITKSLATRHQHFMYLHYKKNFEGDDPFKFTNGSEIPYLLLNSRIRDEIFEIFNKEFDVIFQGKSLFYQGQQYSSGSAVVIGFQKDDFVFGRIESVFNIQETPYICLKQFETLSFVKHYNAYSVAETDTFKLIKVTELYDYHPLGIYQVNVEMYIPLHHYITPP